MTEHPFQFLLLQIILILVAARICGRLVRLLGQPQVVGEMLAGILLGPTLLGRIDQGHLLKALFPAGSRANLDMFSQLGVVLFMFMVGLELDLQQLRKQGRAVLLIGIASMIGPFTLGLLLAIGLQFGGYGTPEGSTLGFILFMATAMSITAFPVLARILTEGNLHRTRLGTIAIACAALNDMAGWCLLAVVFAITRAQGSAGQIALQAGITVGLAGLYVVGMLLLIRPLLGKLQAVYDARGYLTADVLAVLFILLALSSFVTDRIGIHALFGAFMLGAVMPSEPRFVAHLNDRIEDLTTLFLLPLFFAFIGLRTDLWSIQGSSTWLVAILITVVATAGKVGGTFIAARHARMETRQGLVLGVLMNTRGLMELIVLNLALQLHAISTELFSMMVVMTLVTTMMTAPVLALIYPRSRRRANLLADDEDQGPAGPQVVVAVARPDRVRGLVEMGAMLLGGNPSGRLWALHVDRAEDHEHRDQQADPLALALDAGQDLGVPVRSVSLIGEYFDQEIVDLGRRRQAAWIVMGWHKPILDHSALGRVTGVVMRQAACGVAVLLDKGLGRVHRVLVPYLGDPQDQGVLLAAELLSHQPGLEVTILHLVSKDRRQAHPMGVSEMLERHFPGPAGAASVRLQVVETASPIDKTLEESHRYDLVVLGLSPAWRWGEGWLTSKQESIAQQCPCSLLVVRAPQARGHHRHAAANQPLGSRAAASP